jgi:CotH kinase protein/Lamin Tail Domain/Chitobiase/beta-hexosaminidase C-terminal domain/Immunoglobulin domain/Bacterial TSP3 repeat
MHTTPYRSRHGIPVLVAALVFAWAVGAGAATLFPTNAVWKYFKGQSEASLPEVAAWRLAGFDDAPWSAGSAPFYYGEPLSGTPLSDMANNYTCVFLRQKFTVTNQYEFGALTLSARCDDGYIAWINGVEVARYNLPSWFVPYDGLAILPVPEPAPYIAANILNPSSFLVAGTNIMAVQAFNAAIGPDDFQFNATLLAFPDTNAPVVAAPQPPASGVVSSLRSVEVDFSEAVTGVDATDLLVNGAAAANVVMLSPWQYRFEFPQPAAGTVSVAFAEGHGIFDLAPAQNAFGGGAWSYTLDLNAPLPLVRITEFMAANAATILDEDGDSSGWIELHNAGTYGVSLAGWLLTDEAAAPAKWRFPPVTLGAGQFTVVWASAKNRTNAAAPLHTSFKLDRGGGYLGLFDAGTNLISAFTNYPSQFIGASYGALSNAPGYFGTPTPGASNATQFAGRVDAPGFSHQRGFYYTNFSLVLTSKTAGATIYFTTNGTSPSPTNGVLYLAPLAITNTAVIRAAGFAPGLLPSDAHTHTFLFTRDIIRQPDGVPPPGWPTSWGANTVNYGMDPNVVNDPRYRGTIEEDLRAMPSVSVVMNLNDLFNPVTGIYANPGNDGSAWERPMSLELIYPDGRDGFQEGAGIRIRGGFSRDPNDPKHSFRFFFREKYGASQLDFPMFGPDGAQSFDKFDLRCTQDGSWAYQGDANGTFLADMYTRTTQGALGQPHTRGNFYHLYINGVYWGVYNSEERAEASFAASYFGGEPEDYDTVRIEYGPFDVVAADGDLAAWKRLWQAATNGFASIANYQRVQGNNPDGTPNPAYEVLLDMDNLIDYMLLTIYVGSYDGPVYMNSFPNNFFATRNRHTREGFRFTAHDAELSLSDVNYDRTGIITVGDPAAGSTFSESNPQYMWQRLWANTDFRLRAADHVQKHFFNGGPLTPSACLARYAALTNEIYRGMVGESARWGDAQREPPLVREDWVNAVSRVMNNYLPNRSAVVLQQLRNRGLYPAVSAPVFSQLGGEVPDGYPLELTHTNASGVVYFTTDGTDPRLLGGAVNPAAQAYSTPIIINAPVFVRARVLTGTNWSAMVEAVLNPPQDLRQLLITEIMYNPPAAGLVDGDEYEFLELKNSGTNTLNLSGLRFVDGITFVFTLGTTLGPGQFFVIVRNPEQFAARYPGVPISGVYGGRLDNGGENLRLVQFLGSTLLSVTYDDRAPWAVTPDGHGFSLVPVDPNAKPDPNDARNWRGSSAVGGSPGADDPAPTVPAILINEALTASVPPELDTIELFNPTLNNTSIGGWFLTDEPDTPKKFRIPDGTSIGAGGFAVFDETQFNPTPGISNSFSLRAEGDDVYLFSADAAGNLTGYSHGFSFGAAERGVTFGRYRLSTGEDDFTAQAANSLGGTNAGPKIGSVVINEIHYHPDAGDDEFIELRNLTSEPVALFDPSAPANTWRLNGLGFDFPQGVVLGSNALLLIVPTDPAAFRLKYAVSPEVVILGPYAGQLQDSGESLELQKPGPLDTNGAVAHINVDAVRYNDKAPWPPAADGSGPSLQRKSGFAYGNDPINWEGALPTPGRNFIGGPTPVITAQPVSVAVVATREATFNVAATGPAPIFYQWRHNGTPLLNANNPTLLLTNLQFSQAGNYTALVFNENGSVESDIATLNVLVPANILAQPTNRFVKIRPDPGAAPETNVTFTVVASSTTPIRYQWRFNGTDISGATNRSLTVTNVQLSHEGVYDATLTDAAGTIFSGAAYLQPLITPFVVRQPASQNVAVGAPVTLSVAVGGHPKLFTYEWRRGGSRVFTNVTTATINFYTATVPNVATSLTFSVIVKNLANSQPGIISGTATITVLLDTDNDGLPDAWEAAYGFATNNAANATLDSDGDGMSNWQEYVAGTDPTNALSYLKIDSLTAAGGATISFGTIANKTYTVHYTDALGSGLWSKLADVPAQTTNATEAVFDPSYTSGRYYRLATPRQP